MSYTKKLFYDYLEICILRICYQSFNVEFYTKSKASLYKRYYIKGIPDTDFYFTLNVSERSAKLSISSSEGKVAHEVPLSELYQNPRNEGEFIKITSKMLLEAYMIQTLGQEAKDSIEENRQEQEKEESSTSFIKRVRSFDEVGVMSKMRVLLDDGTVFMMLMPTENISHLKVGHYIHLDERDSPIILDPKAIH